MSNYLNQAKEILSHKNSGPSGVLAFVWANAYERVEHTDKNGNVFEFLRPYVDDDYNQSLEPYFTVVETNRSGLTVAAPPGGTQDILYKMDGEQYYAELVKPQKQVEFLTQKLGYEGLRAENMSDELFVAKLLEHERVLDVRLEEAFLAAARETEEEHGWDYQSAKDKATLLFETDETLLSKRSFITDPPTPVTQKIFVVRVDNFDGVIPRRTNKIESKIPSLLGNAFYEQGNFMSVSQLQQQVAIAEKMMKEMDNPPDIVTQDYGAALSRLEMVQRIRSRLEL